MAGLKRKRSAPAVDEALKKDVADVAAALGLTAGGGGDFDDFDPAKANVKLGAKALEGAAADLPTATAGKRKSSNKFKSDDGPPLRKRAVDPEVAAAVKERTWKEGVGGRPGAVSSKSLLGTDDSNLWYETLDALPVVNAGNVDAPDDVLVETKTRVAERLMEAEAGAFGKKLSKANPADAQWLQSVRQSGTMRDKIAAHALLVEESAVANMAALDELMAMVTKAAGARDVVGQAVDALKELFKNVLLPDRKLVPYHKRPFRAVKPSKEGDKRLLLWWTEDCIKKRYAAFLEVLVKASTDDLDWIKEKALKAAYELLTSKPEREAQLLSILVNKLGDPNRKVASKAGFLMSCLLTEHPFMGPVVVREVEDFLFRPGQKNRARYYAIVTLNQMVLSHNSAKGGSPLAAKLIDIYFTIFRLVLDREIGIAAERNAAKKDVDKDPGGDKKDKKVSKDGKRTPRGRGGHKGKGGAKGHGRSRAEEHKPAMAEEVDARMLGALITGMRRAFPFVEAGQLDGVFEKHADQLFRTVHLAPFNVGTQALMLLFQVMNAQDAVSDRFYGTLYAALLNPALGKSSALTMFLSLVFQAVKADVSAKRAASFIKRLLQVAAMQQPNIVCGVLVLVSELLKAQPTLWTAVTHAEDANTAEAVDQDERDGDASPLDAAAVAAPSPRAAAEWPGDEYYDMHKRAPQYARAERACWWELAVLARHAHPSVATMAGTLLAGTSILYNGDPLKDLTLLAFLDKFVKKRAKDAADKGASAMQPVRLAEGDERAALGSSAFAALAEADIAPEDVFFHKFFTLKSVKKRQAANRRKRKGKKAKAGDGGDDVLPDDSDDDGDGASDGSEAEDAFLEGEELMEDDDIGDPTIGMDPADFASDDDDAGSDLAEDDDDDDDSDVDDDDEDSDDDAGAGDEAELDQAVPAGQDITDAELDALDILNLPSPDGSYVSQSGSDEDSDSDPAAEGPSPSGAAAGVAADGEAASVSSDDDDDDEAMLKAIFGGADSGDEDDGVPATAPRKRKHASTMPTQDESGSESEDDGNVTLAEEDREDVDGKTGKKKKNRHAKAVFASYEDYADMLDELDKKRGQQRPSIMDAPVGGRKHKGNRGKPRGADKTSPKLRGTAKPGGARGTKGRRGGKSR